MLCDDVVGATPMHRVSFPDWGLDVSTAEMTVVDDIVRGVSSVVDVPVHPVARLGKHPLISAVLTSSPQSGKETRCMGPVAPTTSSHTTESSR